MSDTGREATQGQRQEDAVRSTSRGQRRLRPLGEHRQLLAAQILACPRVRRISDGLELGHLSVSETRTCSAPREHGLWARWEEMADFLSRAPLPEPLSGGD